MAEIKTLIDKQDAFEIVRDQIAAILADEVASQMALATAGGKDPQDWKLRVYTERSNPWEAFLDVGSDKSPIVSVWYDSGSFDRRKGNVTDRQHHDAIYNIDIYGYGVSADIPAGGHTPGDREASFEAQRGLRLVRNILMAAPYTYLGLRGLVGMRWPRSIQMFQPQQDSRTVQQIVSARLPMEVSLTETSPQNEPQILEYVSIDVKRAYDGEIIAEADYDYTI